MKRKTGNEVDLLSTIQKIEVPPFLLTRIRQKIETFHADRYSKSLTRTLGFSFALVLCLNIFVFVKIDEPSSQTQGIAATMNLLPDNTLYK